MSTDTREALAALLYASEEILLFEDNSLPEIERFEAAKEAARTALATQPAQPSLHPATADLVRRFSQALAEKLAAAEAKYGYSDGWASPDWMDECRAKLMEHIAKGDPRDVAAYCAFLWHHGASTAQPSAQGEAEDMVLVSRGLIGAACAAIRHKRDAPKTLEELRRYTVGDRSAPAAQPSAQGEAVAWRPGDPIYDDAYVRGVAVGFAADDIRRTTLLRIADRIEARASAPAAPAQRQEKP